MQQILDNISPDKLSTLLQESTSWSDFKMSAGLKRCDQEKLLDYLKEHSLNFKHLPSGKYLKNHIWSLPEGQFRAAVKDAQLWSELMINLGFLNVKLLQIAKDRIKKLGVNAKHLQQCPQPDLEPLLFFTQQEFKTAMETPLKQFKNNPPQTWRELCTALGFPAKAKSLVKLRLKQLGIDHSHIVQKKPPKPDEAFKMNSKVLRPVLIQLLLEKRPHKCEWCGVSDWRGKPVPLRMIRKGNDPRDNREDNLVLICANCKG